MGGFILTYLVSFFAVGWICLVASSGEAWGLVLAFTIPLVIATAVTLWDNGARGEISDRLGGVGATRDHDRAMSSSAQVARWRRKRAEFEEQKGRPYFRKWKNEQYRCQEGKCAWCQKPIDIHSPLTHVDHVKPLFWGGTNQYANLVLSCSECNKEKGDSVVGYGGEGISTNVVPAWIKLNRYSTDWVKSKPELDMSDGGPPEVSIYPTEIPNEPTGPDETPIYSDEEQRDDGEDRYVAPVEGGERGAVGEHESIREEYDEDIEEENYDDLDQSFPQDHIEQKEYDSRSEPDEPFDIDNGLQSEDQDDIYFSN